MTVTKLHQREVTWEGEGAPVDGETGAHRIGLGCLYVDILTGNTYANIGTMGVPEFVAVGGGGGGSVPDPLTIGVVNVTDHAAFGASPASTGQIRLGIDAAIESRNYAGDADIQQFKPSSFVNGGNHYNSTLIGRKILEDTDYNTYLVLFNEYLALTVRQDPTAYDGDTDFLVTNTIVSPYGFTASDSSGNTLFLALTLGDVLHVGMKLLPTTDPALAGRVWSAGFADIAALDTYLQAGGKLLALSSG